MRLYRITIFILAALVTACQTTPVEPSAIPSQTPISTNVLTLSPPATRTVEPSATPISLPDPLKQTFSDISAISIDTFEYVLDNVTPPGWVSDEKYAATVNRDNQLKIHPGGGGTVFYFSGERITQGKGVYFTFKYTGTAETFTLGFDAINTNGQRIPFEEEGFYSVAMQLNSGNKAPYAYGNNKHSSSNGPFEGNINLVEDTWYNIALAYDKKENDIIKIWQPEDPQKQITYLHNWADFPTKYYFISWISSKRTLFIDDFTVFKFKDIIHQ